MTSPLRDDPLRDNILVRIFMAKPHTKLTLPPNIKPEGLHPRPFAFRQIVNWQKLLGLNPWSSTDTVIYGGALSNFYTTKYFITLGRVKGT